MQQRTKISTLALNGLLTLFLGLMVGLVMIRISPLTVLPGRDSGFFLYSGEQILKGKLPYIDFWDSKGPAIFYLDALGLWVGSGSRWGVWLVEFILLVLSSIFFYKAVAKLWGDGAALFASAAWLYSLSHVIDGGNLTEEYSLFFSFILLGFFLREGAPFHKLLLIILGATSAINFLFRANNVGVQFSIFLVILVSLLTSRQLHKIPFILFWTIISAGFVFALVSLYFIQYGIFEEMFKAAILYNFYYSGANKQYELNLWNGIRLLGWPVYIALAGYLAAIYLLVRKQWREIFPLPVIVFILVDFPLEVFLSSLSGKNYTHYFISWLPPIALLCGVAYKNFSRPFHSLRFLQVPHLLKFSMILIGIILLVVYIASVALFSYKDLLTHALFERDKTLEKTDDVAQYLQANTNPDDLVLIWGAYPVINFLSRRDAPTPYLFYPAYEKSPFLEQMDRKFYQDITTKKPIVIVDAYKMSSDYVLSLNSDNRSIQLKNHANRLYQPPRQNDLFTYIQQNYLRIQSIDGYDIYRLITP